MSMRNIRNKNKLDKEAGLVQQFINSAYDTVKYVADNMEALLDVTNYQIEGDQVLSTDVTVGWVLQANGDGTCSFVELLGGGNALTSNPLSQFALTSLVQLNSIMSDATLIDTLDPRLSDSRDPNAHTHPIAEITGFTDNSTNWDTAFGWGDHAGLYSVIAHEHAGVYAPVSHSHPTPDINAVDLLSLGEAGGIKFLREDGDGTVSWQEIPGGGDALTSNPLSQFAATTLAQLNTTISDATLIDTADSRLSDARTPTTHTHVEADITDLGTYVVSGGALGTPTSGTLTNCTGYPTTGLGLTASPLSQFAATTSAQLAGVLSDETGSGAAVFATSPTLVTPALGTPASGNLSNCTGFPTTADAVYNAQTGTTYTIQASDAGKIITLNNAASIAVTLPDTLDTNFQCTLIQIGAGAVTVTPNTDTINGASEAVVTAAQWNAIYLSQNAATEWIALVGEVGNHYETFGMALSDTTSDLTATTDIDDFTFPYDFEMVEIFTTTKTAPTGATLITDVNLTGTGTILSTKISQDVSEVSSLTAATPPVLSTTTFSKGDVLTFDRDQVGSSVAGVNQKIYMVGYQI